MLANGSTQIDSRRAPAAGALAGSATDGAPAAAPPLATNRLTSDRNASQALSAGSPCQCDSSAVWVSSNMIGRSQGSMVTGTSVLLRSARVASARTQRETTDFFDQSTTTALASRSACSVTSS